MSSAAIDPSLCTCVYWAFQAFLDTGIVLLEGVAVNRVISESM